MPKKSKEIRSRRPKLKRKSKNDTVIERKKKFNPQIIKHDRNRNLNIAGKMKSPLTSKPVTSTKLPTIRKGKNDSVEGVVNQTEFVDETDLDDLKVLLRQV